MTKIHPIESCLLCGIRIKPLKITNTEGLLEVDNLVRNFRKDCFDKENQGLSNEGIYLSFVSAFGNLHKEADVTYYLCPRCCAALIYNYLETGISIRRKILFQNFDKIKKELKGERCQSNQIKKN